MRRRNMFDTIDNTFSLLYCAVHLYQPLAFPKCKLSGLENSTLRFLERLPTSIRFHLNCCCDRLEANFDPRPYKILHSLLTNYRQHTDMSRRPHRKATLRLNLLLRGLLGSYHDRSAPPALKLLNTTIVLIREFDHFHGQTRI